MKKRFRIRGDNNLKIEGYVKYGEVYITKIKYTGKVGELNKILSKLKEKILRDLIFIGLKEWLKNVTQN